MNEIDEMIGYVEEWLNGDENSGVLNDRVIYPALLAEVRRLRAAVEAVRELERGSIDDPKGGTEEFFYADDVLAALEVNDGD